MAGPYSLGKMAVKGKTTPMTVRRTAYSTPTLFKNAPLEIEKEMNAYRLLRTVCNIMTIYGHFILHVHNHKAEVTTVYSAILNVS